MKNKLFFGGLAWGTTEASLRAACQKYGEIEDVAIIQDRATGRSKGFGFVTFTTDEAAAKALEEMNGMVLDGRPIKVDFPREREPRREGWSGGGGGDRDGYGRRGGGYGGDRGDRGGRRF
jgi:RNA recognition motif-containing protein